MTIIKRHIPHYNITIHMTDCPKTARRTTKRLLGKVDADNFRGMKGGGMVVYDTGKSIGIMCVDEMILSTLAHECFHLGIFIADNISGDVNGDSEPYAYISDWLFKEFLENVWNIEDKQ